MNPIGSPLARSHVLAIGLRGGGVLGHLWRQSMDTTKDKETGTRGTGKERPVPWEQKHFIVVKRPKN